MTCPHCNAELTPEQVRSLRGQLHASLPRKRSGGKVWRKHRAGYSRCRCAKCNRRREIDLRGIETSVRKIDQAINR